MHRRICYLVDAMPSPTDSFEIQDSFSRGMAGLRKKIAGAEQTTDAQLSYVGEWHSHSDECPALPSLDDAKLHEWLADHLQLDALPAVMLIIRAHEWSVVF
jgi:hypothetical protein